MKPNVSFSPAQLAERTLHRRAVEAVIWGMPAVNFDLMYQAMVRDAKAGAGSNKIVYWSRLSDWKNQTLTPNPDAVYFMPFFDTKDVGPVVLEIPPADEGGSITGSVMDCWQAALEDVGPAGIDKGKGGKCLIFPPGYQEKVPDGYMAMPASNFQGYALLRSILQTGDDAGVAKAVAYAKRLKLYPLSQGSKPPETTFIDASGIEFAANIPYDSSFYDSLDRMVQREPWLTRDKAMIDVLKSIGIEKGRPFKPDEATRRSLNVAAIAARAWLDLKYELCSRRITKGGAGRFIGPIVGIADVFVGPIGRCRPGGPEEKCRQLPQSRCIGYSAGGNCIFRFAIGKNIGVMFENRLECFRLERVNRDCV
jgi:hypothetical protein